MWFSTYFLRILSPILTFLSSRPMTLHDQIPCFLTFLTYSTVMLLCCILPNNTRLYSFLWLTGRVLKNYFGKLFFSSDGSQEQRYEAYMERRLTIESGRMVRCYTMDVVTGCCYTSDVVTHWMFLHHALIQESIVTPKVLSQVMSHHPELPFTLCCCAEAGKCGYYST